MKYLLPLIFLSFCLTLKAQIPNPVVLNAKIGEFSHGSYPTFGDRTHAGIDLIKDCGSKVFAMADGRVIDIVNADDKEFYLLGYVAIIKHPSYFTGKTFYTLYSNLQGLPLITVGDEVKGGKTQVGKVGSSGVAFDCQTHFEVRFFPDRLSKWDHIYGSGDRSETEYFKQNWDHPIRYFIDYPSGLTKSMSLGQKLIDASREGDVKKVRKLLEAGADPAYVAPGRGDSFHWGYTPLIGAVMEGKTEIVSLLLDAGANADGRGPYNSKVIDEALKNSNTKIVELLLGAGAELKDKPETLVSAATGGHEGIVKLLISKGVDVNVGAGYKGSEKAIMGAAENGHLAVVRVLIKKGADINVKHGATGKTPLEMASENGHKKVVKYLQNAGAEQ